MHKWRHIYNCFFIKLPDDEPDNISVSVHSNTNHVRSVPQEVSTHVTFYINRCIHAFFLSIKVSWALKRASMVISSYFKSWSEQQKTKICQVCFKWCCKLTSLQKQSEVKHFNTTKNVLHQLLQINWVWLLLTDNCLNCI